MKKAVFGIILIFFCFLNAAISIPASKQPILSDTNMISDFIRIDPDDKQPERLSTKAWLWQDESYLIVHFEAEIDSSFTKGSFTPRDWGATADMVRVQLITIPDAYYAYYYCAYPLGNLSDGIRNSNMNVSYDWDSTYSYDSTYTETLWKVTMRIPLSEIRFRHTSPYRWRIILTRYNEKDKEFFSSPYCNTNMKLDYFTSSHSIELSEPIKRSLNFSFKPYFVKSYDLINKTDSFDPDHIGMDISLSPSQRTRIKITMNPDFSDVPPDAASDNYNSKYPPWQNENRFFFVEDIDAFALDDSALQTRNIVQPVFAYKLTGSTDQLRWGILGAKDKKITDGDYLINDDNYYQILSLNPKWKRVSLNNTIISISNENYYNHLYCGSYSWEMLKDIYLNTGLWGSIKDQYDVFTKGYMVNSSMTYSPKNWDASLYATTVSKDMAADAGYFYDNDFDKWGYSFDYGSDNTKNTIRRYSAGLWGEFYYFNTENGILKTYSHGANASLTTNSDINIYASGGISQEADLENINHDLYNSQLNLGWYHYQPFKISSSIFHGSSIIYALGETHLQNAGTITIFGDPTPKLNYNLSWSKRTYDYPKNNVIGTGEDAYTIRLDNDYSIFNANLTYTTNTKFRLKSGLGISTYENGSTYANLNYYTNLRYEFHPDYFAYLGVQTTQIQDDKPSYDDWTGHFSKQTASAYLKIAVKL